MTFVVVRDGEHVEVAARRFERDHGDRGELALTCIEDEGVASAGHCGEELFVHIDRVVTGLNELL